MSNFTLSWSNEGKFNSVEPDMTYSNQGKFNSVLPDMTYSNQGKFNSVQPDMTYSKELQQKMKILDKLISKNI